MIRNNHRLSHILQMPCPSPLPCPDLFNHVCRLCLFSVASVAFVFSLSRLSPLSFLCRVCRLCLFSVASVAFVFSLSRLSPLSFLCRLCLFSVASVVFVFSLSRLSPLSFLCRVCRLCLFSVASVVCLFSVASVVFVFSLSRLSPLSFLCRVCCLFFMSRYVMFNILLSIFVCAAASLFFAWVVSAHVSTPYVIAGSMHVL